jgi:hypothetical protein
MHPETNGPAARSAARRLRRATAPLLGAAGAIAYNWWIAVLFIPGLLTSVNAFYSDLEASGLRDATLFQHLDIVAGLCWLVALVIRGSVGRDGSRRAEWLWCVACALCGGLGGVFVESCPEGTNEVCRNLEWHLHLPLHHYLHLVVGTGEFAFAVVAMLIAAKRTRHQRTPEGRVYVGLFAGLVVVGPLLGLAYLTDRLGALLEPWYFLGLTMLMLTELVEPNGPPTQPIGQTNDVGKGGTTSSASYGDR